VSHPDLVAHQRRFLRALAHPLKSLVRVGKGGLSDAVIEAVDRALADHELVKVRWLRPEDKRAQSRALAERCRAHWCGGVGHTAVLYREHPEAPRIRLPARARVQAQRAVTSQAAASRRTPSGVE
jgi:RNA-binding protein